MSQPSILGMPRFPSPPERYDRANEAQFRQLVERLLQSTVSQVNDTANAGDVVTSTLQFSPDNTIDLGDYATPLRPRTGYFATSVVAPLFSGATLSLSGSGALGGGMTVAGTSTLNGDVVLGDSSTDLITGSATVGRNLLPTDASFFLGNSTHRWSQVWVSGSLIFKKDALAGGFYTGLTFSSVATGITGWSIYPKNTEVGDAGYDLFIQRSDSGGDFPWLTVTRDTGAYTIVGNGTLTGMLNVSGATTLQSSSLTINGLTYAWPGSQAANRLLRNTGPGTLAWSQVDLTTDITGIIPSANVSGAYSGITGVGTLASGAVPASLVTAGTFGAGAYTFPSTLEVLDDIGFGATADAASFGLVFRRDLTTGSAIGARFYTVNNGVQTEALRFERDTVEILRATSITGAVALASTLTAASSLTVTNGFLLSTRNVNESGPLPTGSTIATFRNMDATAATLHQVLLKSAFADTGGTERIGPTIAYYKEQEWTSTSSTRDAGMSWYTVTNGVHARFMNVTSALATTFDGNLTGGTYNGQTISSAASFTGTVQLAGHLILAPNSNVSVIRTNTADASDTALLQITPASSASNTRGAFLNLYGNEHATLPGNAIIGTGNVTGAEFIAQMKGNAWINVTRPASTNIVAITGTLSVSSTASATQYTSTIATGTAPLVIASTTKVANLNADLLDDQTGSYYLDLANASGTLDETLGGTGLTSYTLGDLLYASASNTLSKLAGNTTTTGQYLKQTGNGSVSAAPVWDTLTAADVGAGVFPAGSYSGMASFTASNITSLGDVAAGNSVLNESGVRNTFSSLTFSGTTVTVKPTGNSAVVTIAGNNSGASAALTLYGTSHANAGRIDLVSGGTADLNLTAGSGLVKVTTDLQVASGKVYKVNGTQVVAARDTGWTAFTGTTDKATAYATGSVTLVQLAERVAQLQAALTTHGLIGA